MHGLQHTRTGRLALAGAIAALTSTACSRSPLRPDEQGGASTTSATSTTSTTTSSTESPPLPSTVLFRLRFISDVEESIFVDETDPAWLATGHWLTLHRADGATLRKERACETCDCDECPNCPICGAPCPTVTEIRSGSSVEWLWPGTSYRTEDCPSDPSEPCLRETPTPAGSYSAEFCWGLSYDGSLPCPADLLDVHCAEVPFVYPDPDGEVEYLVDNAG